MLATPLQMAMVAAAIANGGVVLQPYVVQQDRRARRLDRRQQTKPQTLGRAIKPQTAAELNQMMQLVVQGGTGRSADSRQLKVAGKTGTAETGLGNVYDAWFVCFAPADNPRSPSRSSSRSSRTASAARSRPRSRRPSSKN